MTHSKDIINIVYSTDHNGIDLMLVSIFTLLINKNKTTDYRINIMHDDSFIANDFNKIDKLINSRCQVNYINCTEYDKKFNMQTIFKTEGYVADIWWPSPMYYFLLSGVLLPSSIKKIIYIDIDTIINIDLSDFSQFDLKTTFTATKCVPIKHFIELAKSHSTEVLPPNIVNNFFYKRFIENTNNKIFNNYSNSGVLLVDMEKLRRVDLEDLFKVAKQYHFNDQDLISYYFVNDLSNFSLLYNFCIHFFIDDLLKISAIREELKIFIHLTEIENFDSFIKILHFTTMPKPQFFFNNDIKFILNQVGDNIEKYCYLLMSPTLHIRKYKLNLTPEQNEYVYALSKEWIKNIYLPYKSNRFLEKCYILWGKYWQRVQKALTTNL